MKYSLSPYVTVASHGDMLVFEDPKGLLYELWLEKDTHLAAIQILLASVALEDEIYDSMRTELEGIFEQLLAENIIVVSDLSSCLSYVFLANLDAIVACFGLHSLQRVLMLGGKVVDSPGVPPSIYFTDSAQLLKDALAPFECPPYFVVCEFVASHLTVSPRFGKTSGLTLDDWLTRRRAASWWPEQHQVRLRYPLAHASVAPEQSPKQTVVMVAAIQRRLNEVLDLDSETRIDLDGTTTTALVLKIPSLRTPTYQKSREALPISANGPSIKELEQRLVSTSTGIVREIDRLVPQSWWPDGLHITEAKISDIESVLGWPADRIAAGASWDSPELALASALGESVERYSGNAIPEHGYESGSYSELQHRGLSAIDPETFALFSTDQYEARGFPFVPFTRESKVEWVWGCDTDSGEPCLAPAQLTYVNWYYIKDASLPTNVTMFAGIAAGPSREFAEVSALEEIIERDAVHLWWHARLPAKQIRFSEESSVTTRMRSLSDHWKYTLFAIPSSTRVPVVGCLLLHTVDNLVSLGIASRLDTETAALKAIAEAVQLHEYARGLLDEDGVIWRAVNSNIITGKNLKPVRTDRRYLDSYRGDFHDVVDLPCQMQVYLDPRALDFVSDLWDLSNSVDADEITIPCISFEERRSMLLARVATQASSVVTVDLTTDDIRSIGLTVLRVLAPGMYGNSPTAFPYFGGDRLETVFKSAHGLDSNWRAKLRLEPPPYA